MVGRTHFISYKDSFLMQLTGVARSDDHIILYLEDKPTYAHLSICSITYYYFPATSFGHNSGLHQGAYNNNIITTQIIIHKETIKPLDVTLDNNM